MTAAGRSGFLAWLCAPPTRDEVVRDLDGLFLRFAFMSQALPPAIPRRFLADLEHLLSIHLADLERYLEVAGEQMSLT